MIKAAWAEARRWWPKRVVQETVAGRATLRIFETAILVKEPQPGFREALAAALEAGGYGLAGCSGAQA